MSALSKKQILSASLFLIAWGLIIWWFLKPTPEEVFRRDVQSMIEKTNQRGLVDLADRMSVSLVIRLQDMGAAPKQLLFWVQRIDGEENRQYRLVQVREFHKKDYAVVECQRSRVGGSFEGVQSFLVPFVFEEGKWKVAGQFRQDNQDWAFPE